jgi:predicted metal-dependent hydrolase
MKNYAARSSISALGQYEITFGQKTLVFVLKRSLRARLVWLKIDSAGKLTVTIPRGYRPKLVPQYLQKNLRWILRNLEKCRAEAEVSSLHGPPRNISYLGQLLQLVSQPRLAGEDSIRIEKDKLILNLNLSTSVSERSVLERWLRQEAAQLIESKSHNWSQKIGVKFNKITVRDQKTRWASCSLKGNLSFNWRLIMAPEVVVDYVVVHELCHLHEMNHSRRFWAWVAKFSPDWKERRKWIDSHSRELRLCLQ